MITFRLKTGLMTAAACAVALSAAGCREDDAQRIAVPDPTPAALLPDSMALPYAEAAPVSWTGADAGYRWAERAYGMEQAFYDAPPDYAFDYGGVQPWVWQTADDWAMYAEPWDEGYRYYYYEPGAAYPYFVRDGLYGYGFDSTGMLVALFDADGDYLPADQFYQVAPLAGRYYLHGRDLRNVAVRAQRLPVEVAAWNERAPQIRQASEPWLQAARNDERWRTWRDRTGERELKRFVREERRRERQAIAAQQVARLEPQRIPEERRWAEPRDVEMRRDLARAQREELRAQRDQARQVRHAQVEQRQAQRAMAQRAEAEQRRAERQAERQFAQQAQAEQRRAQREQARAAEAHARQAAAQARAQEDRGPKPDRGGGGGGGGPERQAKPESQDHGGGKPDRGGGGGGEGKGGGKKN